MAYSALTVTLCLRNVRLAWIDELVHKLQHMCQRAHKIYKHGCFNSMKQCWNATCITL